MKRKPTSIVDLIKTVACVSHPELDIEHRHFLLTLAPFASVPTGRNIYPGFDFLCVATDRARDTVRRRARYVEGLGLLEVTAKPTGQGIATEWRLCLENPAYPDSYPGLDVGRVSTKDDLGPQEGKGQEKSLVLKNDGENDDRSLSRPVSIYSSTSTPPSNSAGQPNLNDQIVAGQVKELRRWMVGRWEKTNNTSKIQSRKNNVDWDALRELVTDYGFGLVKIGFEALCIADDLPAGWKMPLMSFVDQFPAYLARAERENGSQYDKVRADVYNQRRIAVDLVPANFMYYEEFKATAEERATYEWVKEWGRKHRDDDDFHKRYKDLDLGHVGPILRLRRRGEDWLKANADLVARIDAQREREELEACTLEQNAVANGGDDEESL
jgi:hypothetical protein